MDAITQEMQNSLRQALMEAAARDWEERAAALDKVDAAAAAAVTRIDWKARATITKVCNRYGPHEGFHFHHRDTVALVDIEGAKHPLYLGANGTIYRRSWGIIHVAEIDKRSEPQHILHIAKLLDAMQ